MPDVRAVAVALAAVLALASGGFLVQPSAEVTPVAFDETLRMGMTGVDVQEAEAGGYELPRAEVFYGQYRYVVGYYGIESMVEHLRSGHARRQFGDPLAVFVTDFSGSEPYLTDRRYVDLDDDLEIGWVRGRDAHFVVESEARTPAGPTILPFSDRADARQFADEYGGRIVDWEELQSTVTSDGGRAERRFESAIENRSAWADQQVRERRALLDRPVSVVVGEDAPTLPAAVARAPPNTTVYVPPGTYETNLTVRKPVTIRGAGEATILDGEANGTVVRVQADRVSVADLTITGVGTNATGRPDENESEQGWDARILQVYGQSDAGILLAPSNDSLVTDVTIDTPSSGIVARYSDGSVVRNVTVEGSDEWIDGLMGVLALYSRLVVEDSTFVGGRDGVYTHRSNDIVVRDSVFRAQRFGVHEMYTSGALVRNNTMRETDAGIIVMTRPANNLLVGNDVRDSKFGLSVVGDSTYVARNVLAENDVGIGIATTRSLVVRNTLVTNDVGLGADTILPTNTVVRNDLADNTDPVDASGGPVHVWTQDGVGNYWASAPGTDEDGDGVVDRPYRPSDRIDVTTGRVAGGPTLARSPALALLRQLEGALPGLRSGNVVDLAPLAEPTRPTVLREVRNQTR